MKFFLDTSALVKIYHKNEAFDLICKYAKTKSFRSLDSIQLTFFETYCDNKDIFVCSDAKLIEIMKIENCKVLTP